MTRGRVRSGALNGAVALLGGVALVTGVLAGLGRLGLDVPRADEVRGLHHGGLMVGGFVVTAIAVERAASIADRRALLVPLLSAAGGIALILDLAAAVAPVLFTASGVGLVALFVIFLRRQPALPLWVMTAGAACWLASALAWLDSWSPTRVIPWWIAFLVLTIAGERLEIARFRRLSHAQLAALGTAIALLVLGAIVALEDSAGVRITGAGALLAGGWLILNDSARRTWRRGDLATYAAVALVACYGWLMVGGAILAAGGMTPGEWTFDAAIHSVFLGFVFGAIFAHAPIIVPAVSGIALRYHHGFLLAVAVLNLSLVVRVASAPLESLSLRQAGAVLNAIAILLLLASLLAAAYLARSASRPHPISRA